MVEQVEVAGPGCALCGGKMVYIRGKHPGMDRREVCPTCMAETLDEIKARLHGDYGRAMQESPDAIKQMLK